MRLAVIVTTYNRPNALELVLAGFAAQSDLEFELIIADDGSKEDTKASVDSFRATAPMPVKHVWQEDQGFRAAAVRNKAALATDAEYFVFTDGDCVPTRNFVRAHRCLAEPKCFLAGSRLLLNEGFTAEVLANQIPIYAWTWGDWKSAKISASINRRVPLLELPFPGFLRKLTPRRWQGVRTCNFSLWRDDFAKANGFDERYSGWGLEDSDLAIRLIHSGVIHKSARFAAPVLHLWHREFDRLSLQENKVRLDALLKEGAVCAVLGLDQYT